MISSPLRYPGGKAKLYSFFSELIKCNRIFGHEYCEPYAGGAGLAIRLLTNGFVDRIHLNDVDVSIYAFWKSVLFDAENFCKLISDTDVNIDQWHIQKQVWREADSGNLLKLGFAAFFLNRTNRSGIIEGAGPIGGYSQSGDWKIDVRLVKDKQIANISALSKYARQIDLYNVDAMEFLDSKVGRENNLVYLDPPYYVKGQKLYKNYYEHDDHVMICELLQRRRGDMWVVSYDDVQDIREIYREFSPINYSLQYSAGQKSTGNEVMYLSDALHLPPFMGFRSAA